MMRDHRGMHVSTNDPLALTALEQAVTSLVCHRSNLGMQIARALRSDPDLALAHALEGFAAYLLARPVHDARSVDALTAAQSSLERRGGTPRERMIVDALDALTRKDVTGALSRLDAVLDEHRRDLMTIKVAHALRFQIGDTPDLLRTTSSVLAEWSAEVPGFSHVLGCHAFALCESGAYGDAERFGHRAVEMAPFDPWAVHAVVHVHEMEGTSQAGLAWLNRQSDARTGVGPFRQHLDWHRALFLIDLGRITEALELFDVEVWPTVTHEYREVVNATSLLWRIEEAGISVGGRWSEVADACDVLANERRLGFAHVHAMLGLLRAGRSLPAGAGANAPDVAAHVSDALTMIARGSLAEGAGKLAACRSAWPALGGSLAQRDLLARITINAAIDGGLIDLARSLLEERSHRFRGDQTKYLQRLTTGSAAGRAATAIVP